MTSIDGVKRILKGSRPRLHDAPRLEYRNGRCGHIVLLGCLAALLGCERQTGDAVHLPSNVKGSFAAPAAGMAPALKHAFTTGVERVYSIQSKANVEVNLGLLGAAMARTTGSQASTNNMKEHESVEQIFDGELHTRIVGTRGGNQWVVARFVEPALTANGQQDSKAAALNAPFLYEIDAQGRFVQFHFREDYPKNFAGIIKNAVSQLQVALPRDPSQTWTAIETFGQERYVAQYAIEGDGDELVLSKAKKAAVGSSFAKAPMQFRAQTKTTVVHSSSEILFSKAQGPIKWQLDERIRTEAGTARLSEHSQVFRAETRPQIALADLPSDIEGAWALMGTRRGPLAQFYKVDRDMLVKLDGLDTPKMMKRYYRWSKKSTAAASRMLLNYVRMHPERSEELARHLDGDVGQVKTSTIGFGFDALARAGHPESQAALIKVIAEAGWKGPTKVAAFRSVNAVPKPNSALAETVWNERERRVRLGAPDLLVSVATNLFGGLGYTGKQQPKMTRHVLSILRQTLSTTTEAKQMAHLVTAIGNVGDFDAVMELVVPIIEQGSSGSDRPSGTGGSALGGTGSGVQLPAAPPAGVTESPRLRVLAYRAFRRLESKAAFEKLVALAEREPNPDVKRQALKVTLKMPQSDWRNAWAAESVARQQDPVIQQALVQILGTGLRKYPTNRTVLQGLLDSVETRRARRAILAYVPLKGGN